MFDGHPLLSLDDPTIVMLLGHIFLIVSLGFVVASYLMLHWTRKYVQETLAIQRGFRLEQNLYRDEHKHYMTQVQKEEHEKFMRELRQKTSESTNHNTNGKGNTNARQQARQRD